MAISRRQALAVALFGTIAGARPALARATALGSFGLDAATLGLKPNGAEDQSATLTRALAEAARREQPLLVPPGRYRIANIALPEGARLIGVAGATQFLAAAPGPMMMARKGKRIALEGIGLDGMMMPLPARTGLLAIEDVAEARIDDIAIANAGAIGLTLLRTGGRVERSRFTMMRDSALFSLDGRGLVVEGNIVEDCGNNGIQIWRSEQGDDGALIRANRVSRIRNDAPGDGQYGNGISLYRAGGIIVEGNMLRDCAYTFIRNNSGQGVQIIGNNGQRAGEVGIYSEFAFEGAIVSNNRIEDVAQGINITNLDHGGRLSVCANNIVRRAKKGFARNAKEIAGGIGIHVEAEAAVTGNVIEDVSDTGLSLGWSWAMRNLVATGNMIRNTDVGIGVSLVPKERNVVVANNVIAGTRTGAVMGTEYGKIVTGDLTRNADRRAAGVRVESNAVG